MIRNDILKNLANWEADSADYQRRNSPQLNRWDVLGWGVWDVLEDDINALGEVEGLRTLELGCGACQFGIKVARRGAKLTGIDFSANQLGQAVANMQATATQFPLVRGNAEELPFGDSSFDLVFCDHGAISFTDPYATIPEAARVLRPGGLLVFNMPTPFLTVAWGNDDKPATSTLRSPYFELGRIEIEEPDTGPIVEWQLTYGQWIRLFRSAGLTVEDLIELRPPEDATTTYGGYAPLEWARDFPAEHIWKVRKQTDSKP